MRHRILRPAVVAGLALSLVAATAAFADTVHTGTDQVTFGTAAAHDLGEVAPGAVREVAVTFRLGCAGTQHVDIGQQVVVTAGGGSVPDGGSVAMDPVVLGPVPVGWAADGDWCDGAEVPIVGVGTVRITAPAAAGGYTYSILFDRILDPVGADDDAAFGMTTTALDVSFTVVEAVNTPPILVLPGAMTVEAEGPDGWTAAYVVTATDAEDDPDPVPACVPAVGAVLPLGTTTVACSVTDAGGLATTGSFDVTVTAKPSAPEPAPGVPVTAVFQSPVRVDGLDGRAGRTIPLKVRLAAGEEAVGTGSLLVTVAPCAGGDPVRQVEMGWRAAGERWFGLLRTKGLEAGCYAVRALHDGVDVGGFELRLFGRRAEVATDKAVAPKDTAAAGKRVTEKASRGAAGRGNGKGGS